MEMENRDYDKGNDGAKIRIDVGEVIKNVLLDSLNIVVSGGELQWFFHKKFKMAPFLACCLKTIGITIRIYSYEEYKYRITNASVYIEFMWFVCCCIRITFIMALGSKLGHIQE